MSGIEELEDEYFNLSKPSDISYMDLVKKPKKTEVTEIEERKSKLKEIEERKDQNPINMRDRFNLLERRVEELEKSLILSNKNFNDYRKITGEKLHDLEKYRKNSIEDVNRLKNEIDAFAKRFNDKMEIVEKGLGNLDRRKGPSREIEKELSSLKSIVDNLTSINKEIVTKTPQFLRELESKVNDFNKKIKTLDQDLKSLKEETEKEYLNRPVIIE